MLCNDRFIGRFASKLRQISFIGDGRLGPKLNYPLSKLVAQTRLSWKHENEPT